jgi:hypothetical protein
MYKTVTLRQNTPLIKVSKTLPNRPPSGLVDNGKAKKNHKAECEGSRFPYSRVIEIVVNYF